MAAQGDELTEPVLAYLVSRSLLPGHGPAGASVSAVVAFYRAHRAARLDQVVAAVAAALKTSLSSRS